MRKPSIGDIWFNHFGNYHYLILADDYEMGIDKRKGYRMLILESGKLDAGWLAHFETFCKFVQ